MELYYYYKKFIFLHISLTYFMKCSFGDGKFTVNKNVNTKKYKILLNLHSYLPGWTYYNVDENSENFKIDDNNLLYVSREKYTIETCLQLVKVIKNGEAIIKGNICLHLLNNLAQFKSRTFTLYQNLPYLDTRTNISLIFKNNYIPYDMKCKGISKYLYSLSKTGIFFINKNVIRHTNLLRKPLTCNVLSFSNSGEMDETKLEINFIDFFNIKMQRKRRNTDRMLFEKEFYRFEVKENSAVNDTIGTLVVTGGSGDYKIEKKKDSKTDIMFYVTENGDLKVRSQLNREEGATQFTIDITATDKTSLAIAQTTVVITILDINDNAPVFSEAVYTKTILEEQSVGKFILTVTADDSDIGENKEIEYSIVHDIPEIECPFDIDSSTGIITNAKVLDREVKAEHVFKVKAQDKGKEPGPLSSEAIVKIILEDINDNKPEFDKERYKVTMFENATVGSTILTITATDKDEGDNGAIQYQALSTAKFQINNDGDIMLNQPVDYDRFERSFMFSVVAFDRGLTPNYANAIVEISVLDVNDNPPSFTRRSFKTTRPVMEDTKNGTVVYKVVARDRDSGDNGKITFYLAPDTPKTLPFALNQKTGEISVKRPLDFEIQSEYIFHVLSKDGGIPPKSDKAKVTILIGNINDNAPRFEKNFYNIDLSEDTNKGSFILNVKAIDPDKISVEDFEYSIIEGDPEQCFHIDPFSGALVLMNCNLNYKRQNQYKLKVQVIDGDSLAGYCYVILDIFDANNNAPKFKSRVNILKVSENSPVGTCFGFVIATDDDTGENARISYTINPTDVFSINASSGEVCTVQRLDREKKVSYQAVVTARDHGKPMPKYGSSTLVVQVLDVNDNAPKFVKESYRKSIPEDYKVGDVVIVVTALDDDDGPNKEIRYSLLPSDDGGDKAFSIAADNGMIVTTKELDRETQASYKLTVVATDQGKPKKLNSTVTVYIELEDRPDSPPVFEKKHYNFTIKENIKGEVGTVKATLADEAFQHMLTYQILDLNTDFQIDRRRGTVNLKEALDYETKNHYKIDVRVVSESSGKTDTAKIDIYVGDINDHSPQLSDFYIFVNVVNGEFDPLFKVPATDKDVSSILRYSILSGNDLNFVKLNQSTGDLTLQRSIMNNAAEQVIKFEVSDGLYFAQAYGRISISEVSSEMVSKSLFIVLSDVTKDSFLRPDLLSKFKGSLSNALNCDSGRIFILSIEDFQGNKADEIPKLEIAVSVREELKDSFLNENLLKDKLYLNQKSFENNLGIKMLSFDYYSNLFCSIELCKNFKDCSVRSVHVNDSSSTTIKSRYVIFRGIKITHSVTCKCHEGYQDGPVQKCSDIVNMCYKAPCGKHGKCVSTDGGFACQCNAGFEGKLCHINKRQSTCPETTIWTSLLTNPCLNGGKCVNSYTAQGGFKCDCSTDEVDTGLCLLSTRHFPKDSYLVMPGLKQRWNISLTFEVSTYEANALLFFNGRYNNENDFLAVEIVDGQIVFTVSLGKAKDQLEKIHQVSSYVAGGINDGRFHKVKILYNSKRIHVAVGEACDIETSFLLNPENKKDYCSASKDIEDDMSSLDLSAPLLIGGLPEDISKQHRLRNTDFVGCIGNIKIEHVMLDLYSPLYNYKTEKKCRQMSNACDTANECKTGTCVNGLYGQSCECPINKVGQFCENDISLDSPAVTLYDGSEVKVFDQTSEQQPWTVELTLRTRKMNSVILEQDVDGLHVSLKLQNGYPVYTFDTLVLWLNSSYISDGRWHHLKVLWVDRTLSLSSDYLRHSKKFDLYKYYKKITLKKFNDGFVGCLKGIFINKVPLNLIDDKNVKSGCQLENACKTNANTCSKNSKCEDIYGYAECSCDAGYFGPDCIDICSLKPCLNDAVCMRIDYAPGFKCHCAQNFTGENCETEIKKECDKGYYSDPTVGLCGPCTCDVLNWEDPVCDKDGTMFKDSHPGKCFCKDGYYDLNGQCQTCDCLDMGSLSTVCDKLTGQCPCKPGIIGRKCDRCPGQWQELTIHCNEINDSCPKTYTEGIWWNRVPPGSTQKTKCPLGANGTATRYCHVRKSWLEPNLFGCTSSGFLNVNAIVANIESGKETFSKSLAISLSHLLVSASKIAKRHYGKDIEIGYNALSLLISYEGNQSAENMVSSDDHEFVTNILYAASKLFKSSSKNFWELIQENYPGTSGLMKEMERLLMILSSNLHYVRRNRNRRSVSLLTAYTHAEENLYLEIQPISLKPGQNHLVPNSRMDWSKQYEIWKHNTVSVVLPNQVLQESNAVINNQINVGVVIYKTLGDLLPSVCDFVESHHVAYEVDVMTDVVTVTIPGIEEEKRFSSGLQIIFKDVKTNISDEPSLSCAFWNFNLSDTVSGGWSRDGCDTIYDNSSDVTCRCTHLTSFALIKVRYTERTPRLYTMEVYTYLGIGIGMFFLLFVFLVYLLLSQLKSNFNSIHKNLAFVMFLALLVFVFGINRPDVGTSGCRIIAICIQYFLTCSFSWLFVESLHMYRMILEPRDINYGQMMFYYFIGWGAPVMVVGVTAGLKSEGYGNEEFCWISIRESTDAMWTYFAPVMALIAGNILLMLCALTSSCEKQSNAKKRVKIAAIRYRVLISMVLIPLMGATMCLALIVVNYDEKLYQMLFPCACGVQGVYMFLFYAILNRKVRRELHNAYIRKKTGDKSYGIKQKRKRPRPIGFMPDDRSHLITDEYRRTLQAFNVNVSSTTDSSDTDARHKARRKVAGSETTDFPTTQMESSDSSDDDDTFKIRRPTIDSDSSDDSGDERDAGKNNKLIGGVEWKMANQKKIIKRTYASDGPMHSTPSESDTSERQRWQRVGFTPTRIAAPDVSVIPSDAANQGGTKKNGGRPAPPVRSTNKESSTTGTDSEDNPQSKKPVGILKKKSQYDGHRLRVRVKDSTKRPLMNLADTSELNDSQV